MVKMGSKEHGFLPPRFMVLAFVVFPLSVFLNSLAVLSPLPHLEGYNPPVSPVFPGTGLLGDTLCR